LAIRHRLEMLGAVPKRLSSASSRRARRERVRLCDEVFVDLLVGTNPKNVIEVLHLQG
jgi:hypothetical protein